MASVSAVVVALLLSSCLVLHYHSIFIQAQSSYPPVVEGLSWDFYKTSCPKLEKIVRKRLRKVFKKDIGQAAALLRIHFHDCFVQGCDGSVLLDGFPGDPSEKEQFPNSTLRKEVFGIINQILQFVKKKCGQIVSCADIIALSARDAVAFSGGPDYRVPLGRRDSLTFAPVDVTLNSLPGPLEKTQALIDLFARINLDITDLVALSGGHTIGLSHCTSVEDRLYPDRDNTMDQNLFKYLTTSCPVVNSNNTVVMDIRTPNKFDNMYYVDLLNRQGLFVSDQDLYSDERTKSIVTSYATNQTLFFEQFVWSMVKMGQFKVLTGTQGEIRANCSATNTARLEWLSNTEVEAAAY